MRQEPPETKPPVHLAHPSASGRKRYRDLNTFLRDRFGFRVWKIPIDGGFTCPNRDGILSADGCIFCDATGSGTGAWARGSGISEQIREFMAARKRRVGPRGFLAYFQAFTNTYDSPQRLRALYDEALEVPGVLGLCIGTRPDCVDEAILDLLAEYAQRTMVWLELGLQSAHEGTLRRINRGHGFEVFRRVTKQASQRGLLICCHLIVGLPGEGRVEVSETALRIAPLPIHGLKIHALYIVRGTALEELYRQGQYVPWSREEYAQAVCDIIERVPPGWVMQRLTGDPSRESLVAPGWTLEKQPTLEAIRDCLVRRDTWQGKIFHGECQVTENASRAFPPAIE